MSEAGIQIVKAYTNRRECARADEYFIEAIAMAPDDYESYYARGWNLVCQGKKADAVPVFEKAAALAEADFPPTQSALGAAYAFTGRRAEALKILDRFKDLSTHQYVDATAFASIYYALGENDVGFKWLEKGYEDRSGYMMSLKMPAWDNLRSDPRLQAIYQKVGLPP